ncbi:Alpha/Beta hydrolase protein [Plectosphaerella cucumerina]|uniref:Alpha/Beta hydrolase protein n=1 Tax=Plectosphaerella cucumerina TaxID=40658 RepID=A0A8K0TTE4_9PEZI|nr:Alpha/Beta hydrolase protein [Plectosphaerella cucumerina]
MSHQSASEEKGSPAGSGPVPPYNSTLNFLVDREFSADFDIPRMREFVSSILSHKAEDVLRKAPNLEHTEYTVPGLNKGDPDIVVSVFKPRLKGSQPLTGVFYVHGGGQVAGSRFNLIENLATMIGRARTIFVSVEYRLPPENPPPAALHDAYAAYLWTVENTAKLGIDPNRIFALGVSSGCLQTASLTALARDNGKPLPCGLLLLCPLLDDRETESVRQFMYTTPWCGSKHLKMWKAVLGDKAGGPDMDPLLAPARLGDLKRFPPTYITVGTCDILRDESIAFASQLWKCGVAAELHAWAGGFHGFDIDFPWAPVAQDSVDTMRGWVDRVLADVEVTKG